MVCGKLHLEEITADGLMRELWYKKTSSLRHGS